MTLLKNQTFPGAVFVFLALIFGMVATGTAAGLETQTSSAYGVAVKVTPKNVANNTKTWDFVIVLDTHSADLGDDLVKSTALLSNGTRYAPIAWEGAPPGGHHREGTLRFSPVNPFPDKVELQIQRPGEEKPRLFLWNLR